MADIPAQLVKKLRDATGAGMMDCKRALEEAEGDTEKAAEVLRKRGITKAEKKMGRTASEGLVASYIHTGGRIGVLVEVNCETDFVAKGEQFQQLVRDIAMQIAASPNVEYVAVSDIPVEVVEQERAIEMEREDLATKPAAMREKIATGRAEKLLKERALLEQAFVKDQSITVEELIKQKMSTIGENIRVRRFSRFVLGEGIVKDKEEG